MEISLDLDIINLKILNADQDGPTAEVNLITDQGDFFVTDEGDYIIAGE